MQQFVTLVCRKIQALAESEILALIPAEVLTAIKAKDPHPFFQAFSICHEGISTPTLLGDTAKPIQWTRRAVQSIKDIVTKGIKFFKGHNEDNSTAGRRELGEVVASLEKEIDGVLHHVAISYHTPEVREEVKQYDICSQEAEWNFFEAFGGMVADTVDRITGIALASSDKDQPAFAGARRLGLVQAFKLQAIDGEPVNKNKGEPMDLTTVAFKELVDEVKRRNTFPSQIYTLDEIKADRVVKPAFDEAETLKAQVKTKDTEIEQLKKNQEQLNKQTQASTAKTRLATLITNGDVKLTDKQKKYVEDNFKEDQISDLTDEGLKNFVISKLDAYKANAAFFGVVDQTVPAGQAKPGEKSATDKDDLTKAANNELLTEDVSIEV